MEKIQVERTNKVELAISITRNRKKERKFRIEEGKKGDEWGMFIYRVLNKKYNLHTTQKL